MTKRRDRRTQYLSFNPETPYTYLKKGGMFTIYDDDEDPNGSMGNVSTVDVQVKWEDLQQLMLMDGVKTAVMYSDWGAPAIGIFTEDSYQHHTASKIRPARVLKDASRAMIWQLSDNIGTTNANTREEVAETPLARWLDHLPE